MITSGGKYASSIFVDNMVKWKKGIFVQMLRCASSKGSCFVSSWDTVERINEVKRNIDRPDHVRVTSVVSA